MLRRQNKEHSEHTRDLDAQIKAINKTAKSQDKEIYNLGKSLHNSQDTVSKLKEQVHEAKVRERKLKCETVRLEKQLKKFDVKNKLSESYCQTNSIVVSDGATQTLKTNDTPCEPLLKKKSALKTGLKRVSRCQLFISSLS